MSPPLEVEPVILAGATVTLAPMTIADAGPLAEIGLDPELWRWIPMPVTSHDDMRAYVANALDEAARGVALPFTIRSATTRAVIGTTRYANIRTEDRGLEIGWTWLAREWQRKAANTEAKYLLLSHAFERLGAVRVELKTDALNAQSRRAIERLGAIREGVFRKHRYVPHQNRLRDTVYYSIIDEDWPRVKAGLLARLAGT